MAVSAVCCALESDRAVGESDFRDDSKREHPLSAATPAIASINLFMTAPPSRESPRCAMREPYGAGQLRFYLNRAQYCASADPHHAIGVGGVACNHRRLAIEIAEQGIAHAFDPNAERKRQLHVAQHGRYPNLGNARCEGSVRHVHLDVTEDRGDLELARNGHRTVALVIAELRRDSSVLRNGWQSRCRREIGHQIVQLGSRFRLVRRGHAPLELIQREMVVGESKLQQIHYPLTLAQRWSGSGGGDRRTIR